MEKQGATFYFTLPIATPDAAHDTDSARPNDEILTDPSEVQSAQPDRTRPLRVLLVEDNIINQRLISRMVEETGAQVFTAPNGAVAVERALRMPFDLILMDIYMPEMDGPEATERILETLPPAHHPYIAAMSASHHEEDRRRAAASGAHAFMGKPNPSRRQELSTILDAARRHRAQRIAG